MYILVNKREEREDVHQSIFQVSRSFISLTRSFIVVSATPKPALPAAPAAAGGFAPGFPASAFEAGFVTVFPVGLAPVALTGLAPVFDEAVDDVGLVWAPVDTAEAEATEADVAVTLAGDDVGSPIASRLFSCTPSQVPVNGS